MRCRYAEGDNLTNRMGALRHRWESLLPGDPDFPHKERFRQQWEAALRQVMYQALQVCAHFSVSDLLAGYELVLSYIAHPLAVLRRRCIAFMRVTCFMETLSLTTSG